MKNFQAGAARKRVQIQRPQPVPANAQNEPAQKWSTYATVWAKVEALTGRELYAAQQVTADATMRVTIRYVSGLSTTDRFLLDGARALNIYNASDEEERHRKHVCMCSEAAI